MEQELARRPHKSEIIGANTATRFQSNNQHQMTRRNNTMETREPKFTYIRDEKGFPVACLAYSRQGDCFDYAVSVHNPKDKFDREMARKVAGGRLLKAPLTLVLRDETKDWTLKDCLKQLMVDFSEAPSGWPTRLQKAAKQYLVFSDC